MRSTTARLPELGHDTTEITAPAMFAPYAAGNDVHVLPAYLPVPGMGVLPANSFVITGEEPVVVDAGPGGLPAGTFEAALGAVVDPADVRWLWLTHTDPDHIGALRYLLDAAPRLRVVTTYLAAGKLGLIDPVPLDRCYFANPGDAVHVGDRKLVCLKPPSFDAPETTSFYDSKTGTYFSADTFGALLDTPAATADDLSPQRLRDGIVTWSRIDAPWLHRVDLADFEHRLHDVRRLRSPLVLGSHLPPASNRVDHLLAALADVPASSPWIGPDQAMLETMLAQMASA